MLFVFEVLESTQVLESLLIESRVLDPSSY